MKRVVACLLACLLICLPATLPSMAAEEKPYITGTHLSLGDDIAVHVYIAAPAGAQSVYVLLDSVQYSATPTEDENVYVAVVPGLALSAMTEELGLVPACRLNGSLVQGEAYYFSVRDYAMRHLVSGTASPALRRVLVALLNYGTAVQVHLDERMYRLANIYLSPDDQIVPQREYASVWSESGEATQEKADVAQGDLVVLDDVRLRFYIDIVGQEELRINGGLGYTQWQNLSKRQEAAEFARDVWVEVADNAQFTNASLFRPEKNENGEGYFVTTSAIYATAYSRTYYLRVCTSEGVGKTYTYSVETYLNRCLGDVKKEETKKMLYAMIEFGDALNAYDAEQQAAN